MKFPILVAAAAALAFSGAALADNADSHAAHHTTQTQAADQATTPAPVAKPADQTPVPANMNCPMMDGSMTNSQAPDGTPQQHMSGGGRMVPMPNSTPQKSMNCPMMQQHPDHTMTLHHDGTQ